VHRLSLIAATLALVLLGSYGPSLGADRPSGDAVRHYVEGRRYMDQGLLKAAEAELEEAVLIDPDYLDALSSLALVYFKQGKMSHYRAVLQRAVDVKARKNAPSPLPRPALVPPQPPGQPAPEPQVAGPSRPVILQERPAPPKAPEPKDVFVLESDGKRDPLGNLRVDGQIKNNTSETVQRVEVSLVAFNSEGKPIEHPFTYRGPWELRPGESATFSIDMVDKSDKVERFDLKPSWEPIQR
jgi:tetratricopeptide (TPR) repeat protein